MSYTIALRPFRKYTQFRGRASRKEFWLFTAFVVAVLALFEFVVMALGSSGGAAEALMAADGGALVYATLVFLVWSLVTVIPSCAVTVRRLHDTGRNGWLLLLWVIPIVGFIVLILCAKQGDREANRYGDPPEEYGEPEPEPKTG